MSDVNLLLAEQKEGERRRNLTDMQTLEEFVVYNTELEQLEEQFQQFNIFEAVGMDKQEIRHSAFLAFLLAPKQPHGLGDDFLKRVLQRALLRNPTANLSVNVVKLHLMDLDETEVEREVNNIDILLLNEVNRLAIIIENKTQSAEHDDQLERYYQLIQRQYSKWSVIGLYLTPDSTPPSYASYLPISYSEIANIIDELLTSRATTLGTDVRTLMSHYVQMLRRNIVSDLEIDKLCSKIYQRHKRAIDLIALRIPNKQAIVQKSLVNMIQETPDIRLRRYSPKQISFHPAKWDVPALQYVGGEDATKLLLIFRLYNNGNNIVFHLELDYGAEERRQPIFELASNLGKPFTCQNRTMKAWNTLFNCTLITEKQMSNLDDSAIISKCYEGYNAFLSNDLPLIEKALHAAEWIWTTETTSIEQGDEGEDSEERESE